MKKKNLLTVLIIVGLFSSCKTDKSEQQVSSKESLENITFVRKNAFSSDGKSDLEAYSIAMKKMKELPCDNVMSWYYQGAMHWVPSPIPNNPLCDKFHEASDALEGWMNCTHDAENISEIHFLIWHRLFILHFEEIVRELSGKADFALPYWDYTDPTYRKLPPEFIDQNSSLYESARLSTLNNGEKIGSEMDNALNIKTLFQNKDFEIFNHQIDKAPHGAMHDYIGAGCLPPTEQKWNRIYQDTTSGLMANVPSAAFDPIFWLHHSNIDRLWEKWEKSPNGSRIPLKRLEKVQWPYLFFNSKGEKVSLTIKEAYDMAFNINYKYDDLDKEKKLFRDQELFVQRQDTSILLNKKIVNVGLKTKADFSVKWNIPRVSSLKSTNNSRVIWVLTVSVSFEKAPTGTYEIFIKDKSSDKLITSEASIAGVMTFFGAEHHKEMGHAMHHSENKNRTLKKFKFDITDEIDFTAFSGDVDFKVNKQCGDEDDLKIEEIILEQKQIQK